MGIGRQDSISERGAVREGDSAKALTEGSSTGRKIRAELVGSVGAATAFAHDVEFQAVLREHPVQVVRVDLAISVEIAIGWRGIRHAEMGI